MLDKIRGARSIKELQRFHREIAARVNLIGLNVSVSAKEIDMSDLSDAGRSTPTRRIGKTATISGPIPELPSLKTNKDVDSFKDINDLHVQLRTLTQALSSKAYDSVQSRTDLRKAIKATMAELKKMHVTIKASFQQSRSNVPTQYTQVLKALILHLKDPKILGDEVDINNPIIIPFTKNKQAYYQAFIEVEGLRNQDNYEYTQYQVVLTAKHTASKDGDTGMMEYFVTSIKSKRSPGSFTLGEPVKKLSNLKQQVNALLSLDKVLSSVDKQPINATTRDLRNRAGIEKIKGVNKVRVQRDEIYVTLNPGLPANARKKALTDVTAVLSTVFSLGDSKNSGNLVYGKVPGRNGTIYKFSLGFDARKTKTGVNLRKLDKLSDMLGLDVSQRQKIAETIK